MTLPEALVLCAAIFAGVWILALVSVALLGFFIARADRKRMEKFRKRGVTL